MLTMVLLSKLIKLCFRHWIDQDDYIKKFIVSKITKSLGILFYNISRSQMCNVAIAITVWYLYEITLHNIIFLYKIWPVKILLWGYMDA